MSFNIKKGDRVPAISAVLAVDLTGATVKFIMRLPGSVGDAKVSASATVTAATTGAVEYAWAANDTNTAGLYIAEWEVTFGNGKRQTLPPDDYLYVNVAPDLG